MGLRSALSTQLTTTTTTTTVNKKTANTIDSAVQNVTTQQLTNVSIHGTMAPALTEPLSQTNKLSSSASPRPSSNALITSTSSTNNITNSNLNNLNHSDFINDLSGFANSTKLNQDNNLVNGNGANGGSFQSAFEEFQQKQLSDINVNNTSVKSVVEINSIIQIKPAQTRKGTRTSVTTRKQRTEGSTFNGYQLDDQMGPMCDTNPANASLNIDNIEDDDDDNIKLVEYKHQQEEEEKDQHKFKEQEASEAIKAPVEHMDSSCDKISEDESQNNNSPSIAISDANRQDIQQDSVVVEKQQTAGTSQETVEGTNNTEATNKPISSEYCDTSSQELQNLEEIKQKTPPRTPTSNSSTNATFQGQLQTTPASSLTPQSTTSGMGLQKDFIKDSAEMDQVLGELGTSDMELLQVLKGFDTTPGGEGGFCELSLFTDVDVMNYEDVGIQQAKDSETKEIRGEIEKRQQLMQRKCDFLLRRLRKIQSRCMGKHTSEEIAGLFEWGANPTLRRKELHQDTVNSRLTSIYDDDKRRQISTATMKAFVRRINSAANAQHSSLIKRNKVGRPSNATLQAEMTAAQNKVTPVPPVVPPITNKITEEIAHVSGHLHTELKEIQSALDSDATASSSGGESADEMQPFNNTVQQPLSITKRAAWKWARDRGAIASRWTWLLAQISDLEYRIRQHNELHHQIKKNKGAVAFEKAASSSATTTPTGSPIQTSSVNGYRGVLPGNSKAFDVEAAIASTAIAPNGAYDTNNSAGACRTRAFQRAGFRKRKLLQTTNVHTVSKKAAKSSTVKCGCQWPLHPCALCTGRSDPTAPRDLPDTMTPSERVALLDPCFHPVLSFPEDVSHSIHLEATIRLPDWQNRVLRCSTKTPTKGSSSTSVSAVQKAAEREDRSKKYVDSRRKYNRKYPQEIMAANKLKNAKNRRNLHGGGQYNNSHHMKSKHRKLVASNSSGNNGGGGIAGCNTSSSAFGAGSNSNNHYGVGGLSSATSSTAGSDSMGLLNENLDAANGQMPRSKNASPTPGSHNNSGYKYERMDRRNRNSYDIDNIVIPYSVAAATRVEILPYKEIPTPKWRIIDDPFDDIGLSKSIKTVSTEENDSAPNKTDNENSNTNESEDISNRLNENADMEDIEDISEEAIHIRHERALIEERKKFQTFLKYPWSTRSRANRRTDSRAESSGANTPDPSSPAPNTPSVGGDQESVPSPAAPSTPQTPMETIDETNSINQPSAATTAAAATPTNPTFLLNAPNSAARRGERKRTASGRKEREHSKDEAGRSLSPDPKEIIPPYDPMEFPLPDDIYEAMLKLMPNDHQLLEDCFETDFCDSVTDDKTQKSRDSNSIVVGGNGNSDGGATQSISDREMNVSLTKINQTATIVTSQNSMDSANSNDRNAYASNTMLTYSTCDNMIGEDSDTDSAESGMPEDDPNDPEWREPQ